MLKVREYQANQTCGFYYEMPSNYRFVGRNAGLYEFEENGKRELFARTKSAPAGWHIQRGAYCFEFVRSV